MLTELARRVHLKYHQATSLHSDASSCLAWWLSLSQGKPNIKQNYTDVLTKSCPYIKQNCLAIKYFGPLLCDCIDEWNPKGVNLNTINPNAAYIDPL